MTDAAPAVPIGIASKSYNLVQHQALLQSWKTRSRTTQGLSVRSLPRGQSQPTVAEIALTASQYKTAERLKADYCFYAVSNCGSKEELQAVRDAARLVWKPVVQVARYHVGSDVMLHGGTEA